MPDIRIIKGIHIMPEQREALRLAGYKEGTASWAEGEALFAELLPVLRRSIQPKAAAGFAPDGRYMQGLYVILTLGGTVTRQAENFSAAHEFSRDLLFNAMADTCLFALEKQVLQQLPLICREKGAGIACRHESGMDIPLSTQKDAARACAAERTIGVTVTDDFILTPEKSMCIVFDLCDDPEIFHMEHDCAMCAQQRCPMRQEASHGKTLVCPAGRNVLSYIREQGLSPAAPCGGKGVCGKCRIRVLKGALVVTPEDTHVFSAAEIGRGWRLACRAVPCAPVTIEVPVHDESSFAVLGAKESNAVFPKGHRAGLAVDIGTTTLAVSLVDVTAQRIIHTETGINSQRRFGADVISRIQAANTGHAAQLHESICRDLLKLFAAVYEKYPHMADDFVGIAVAGNTTMEHLLMAYSCKGLGTWPFRPVSLGGEKVAAEAIFGTHTPSWLTAHTITMLPGISTYVGADITAGIRHCRIMKHDALSLFLDLGTNGEMALGNKDRLVVASTAAGPALEGGNLSCGTGSVRGAISGVSIRHGKAVVRTIGHGTPAGICGTGVIECVAALVEQGLADSNGTLREPYFSSGFPLDRSVDGTMLYMTQHDIREVQMAKAAIRAGIETILQVCGASYDDVKTVYVAGGFGFYIRPDRAAVIGMLPKPLAAKVRTAGNTALAGAAGALMDAQAMDEMRDIQDRAKEIVLANTQKFQQLYIENMDF